MRVMLDTNVLISILIFDSKKLKLLLNKITNDYYLVLSSYVIDELKEVVKRKFNNKLYDLEIFLYNLPFEIYYTPNSILNTDNKAIRDVKDFPVLYSSVMSDVDVLVTGDKDFSDIKLEKPEILTPSDFLINIVKTIYSG